MNSWRIALQLGMKRFAVGKRDNSCAVSLRGMPPVPEEQVVHGSNTCGSSQKFGEATGIG